MLTRREYRSLKRNAFKIAMIIGLLALIGWSLNHYVFEEKTMLNIFRND